MCEICKAARGDLAEILALQYISYQSEAQLYDDRDIPPLRQTLEEVEAEFDSGIILKMTDKDNKIIGSVRAKAKNGTVYIGKLIVHPEHRRKGYGTRLLNEIGRYCPDMRCELFTGSKSIDNIRLYERNGYSPFDRKTVSGGLEFIYLEKLPDHSADQAGRDNDL